MSLVTHTLVTDTFNRANENPLNPTFWQNDSTREDKLEIVSDQCVTTNTDSLGDGFSANRQVLPNNQFVSVQIPSIPNNGSVLLYMRLDSGDNPQNLYELGIGNFGDPGLDWQLVEIWNGSQSFPFTGGFDFFPTYSPTDVYTFACIGTKLYVFQNGVQFGSADITTSTGPVLTSGFSGLQISVGDGGVSPAVINFKAGSASISSPTPGTILGQYPGSSIASAFTNPEKLDILQVVNEGGHVVYNVSWNGATGTAATSESVLGRYFGSSVGRAFPNPYKQDLLQVVDKSAIVTWIDYTGAVNTQ